MQIIFLDERMIFLAELLLGGLDSFRLDLCRPASGPIHELLSIHPNFEIAKTVLDSVSKLHQDPSVSCPTNS